MLCTGTRFLSKFSGRPRRGTQFGRKERRCSARGSEFLPNFQDGPHGSADLMQRTMEFGGCTIFFKILRMLRTGARFDSKFSAYSRFSSKFTGRTARERDFLQQFDDAPHGSAIFFIFLQNVNEEDELERSSLIWN